VTPAAVGTSSTTGTPVAAAKMPAALIGTPAVYQGCQQSQVRGTPVVAGTPATVGIPITPARTSLAAEGTPTGWASQMPFTVERPETTASQSTARPETSLTREKFVDKYFFYWPYWARYI
jgi:hypothetical protein